jgi:hypothetical protein
MEKADRVLVISPGNVLLSIGPDREIFLTLRGLAEEAGLMPGTDVAIRLTTVEAHRLADVLKRKADEAETGLPRA